MTNVQPRLRADACRNRERILAAACDAFVEHGADVPLDVIARRAGVANATLYRRFTDRRDLIRQVGLKVLAGLAAEAENAMAEEQDAFEALRRFAHRAADRRIGAVIPAMTELLPKHEDFFAARSRLLGSVEALVNRAIASGQLRSDVALGDLMATLTLLTRPLPGTKCGDIEGFTHRHVELLLDGLCAPARSELPGTAFTLADLQRACHPTD